MDPRDLTLAAQALDRLLARGHSIHLQTVGDGADVDPDTDDMIHPGWGPYVQILVRDHEDQVVADVHAATVAAALTTLAAPHAQTAPTPPTNSPGGIGRLTVGGHVTELQMPNSTWATPRPGVRQVWGQVIGDGPCPVGRHDLRIELPSGAVLAGAGRVEVTRLSGRRLVKVYVCD